MAGVRINIEFEDSEIRTAMNRLLAAGQDMTPLMRDIGEHLLNTTRERFSDETAPDGTPWAPLSETTRQRKKRNADRILTERGFLRGGLAYRATSDQVEVGSPSIYAGTHQFGAERGSFGSTSRGSHIPWGDIPPRPFLGLSNEDETEIAALVNDYLADSFTSI